MIRAVVDRLAGDGVVGQVLVWLYRRRGSVGNAVVVRRWVVVVVRLMVGLMIGVEGAHHVAAGLLELFQSVADLLADLRQLLRPEKQEGQKQHEAEMDWIQIKECQHKCLSCQTLYRACLL